ncbi:MAG: EFR1 family ferrodoxin, partial [Thermoguttaceae bacterium]|nr:EFR1 family ferrodoxin [Thermoguttaceae bacterium]
ILTRKGFRCLAGTIVTMPDSFFPFFSKKANDIQLERAAKKIVRFAEKFDQGTAHWRRWPILSDISGAFWYAVFSSRRITKVTASTLHVKSDACSGCGICTRFCPVDAMTLSDERRIPQRNSQCVNCLRCVALCPNDAMRHMIGFSPYRSEEASLLQQRFTDNLEKPNSLLSDEEPEL